MNAPIHKAIGIAVLLTACSTVSGSHANPTGPAPAPIAAAAAVDGTILPDQRFIIYAGTLIDGRSDQVKTRVSISVEDGKIADIAAGFAKPKPGQRIVDLRDYTVLPGLIDSHVHLTSKMSRRSYGERFFMDPADHALRAAMHARLTLLAGFTTIRDLGDSDNVVASLRDAVRAGWAMGPRIYTATKSIATTGGHADPTNGLSQRLIGDPGPKEGVINSPEEAIQAVRQRYKDGANLIKITATGGVLSLAQSGQNPQFTADELTALVKAAKDYGFTVAVHAHGAEGMKRAVLAGVDSIEHGTYMTDEIMELMKERGTYFVPTISAGRWVAARAREADYLPAVVRPKAAAIGPQIEKTFARAVRAGVNIAFGTDSGVSPHGDNAREFVYMVEAGMSPMAAIRSATFHSAKLLGIDERVGTVEPGKLADLVAVPGDPLKRIERMLDVAFVMKAGKVYKLPISAAAPE